MGWVSAERQKELDRLARYEQDLNKLEAANEKDRKKLYEEYDQRIEDVTDEYELETRKLTRENGKLKAQAKEAASIATEEAEAKAKKEAAFLSAQLETSKSEATSLKEQIKVYEKRVATEADLLAQQIKLDVETKTLEANQISIDAREKQLQARIKEFDSRVKDANEAQYKSGYTDGVSDTLRKGNELSETANERVFKLAEKAVEPRSASNGDSPVVINNGK